MSNKVEGGTTFHIPHSVTPSDIIKYFNCSLKQSKIKILYSKAKNCFKKLHNYIFFKLINCNVVDNG